MEVIYHICAKMKDMEIVTVIPLKNKSPLGDLTYFTAKSVEIGSIVTIPIRNKTALGIVVFSQKASGEKINIKEMDFNLRKIIEVKENSFFLKEYLETAIAISQYFVTNKSNTITSLIPSILLEKYDEISKFQQKEKIESIKKEILAEKLLLQMPREERILSYKTLIRESFALKKSIFIVLPNEYDIENFNQILSHGIEQFTFSLHSSISPKKIFKKIKQILQEDHPVLILGTAPYLSIPRYDIETIVLEHESSNTYKMMNGINLDLRAFVEAYATKINAKLILSDTILRFETIGRKDFDHLTPMHPLSFRLNFEGQIEIQNQKKDPSSQEQVQKNKFQIFTDENIKEIQNYIDNNKNVFIFTLRKGLATQTICKDCHEVLLCDYCSTPVVLYLSRDGKTRIFSCNKCKKELDTHTKCPNCNSWNLTPLGIGVDTVFEELNKLFPENKIFKIDKDSVKNESTGNKIIKDFYENKGSILVGTEMALFYLKDKIPLSIISSFDSLWSIPNYKMSERITQLLLSIIEKTQDKIIIQSRNSNDKALNALKNGNLISFIREELEDREKLGYPPYKRFIKVKYLGNKEDTSKVRKFLKDNFEIYNPEIFSGFISKEKDKYSTNMLIKTTNDKWSLPELSLNSYIDNALLEKLSRLPPEFNISVDPEDLL
jgi:primosomal protein N' (replication factor Y) (superfamily II helicase)